MPIMAAMEAAGKGCAKEAMKGGRTWDQVFWTTEKTYAFLCKHKGVVCSHHFPDLQNLC